MRQQISSIVSIFNYFRFRAGGWGIYLFAIFSLILALIAVVRLLILIQTVELYSDEFGNQTLVWIIFVLNSLFGLGFAASAYGLWKRYNWGRILFMWLIVSWSGLNLFAIYSPYFSPRQDLSFDGAMISSLRFGFGIILSLVYFNLPRVKELFLLDPAEDSTLEE